MKIGIVTYVKCDNYGAELQAFALQWKLNQMGYDAEVLDLEKQNKDLSSSLATIVPAIINRFKSYGINAIWKIIQLVWDVLQRKAAKKTHSMQIENKHVLFTSFFDNKIRHSSKYYTLKSVYTEEMPYDTFVAGSDQIWNYMHTDYLDVYFLEFANRMQARKIAYAASISVPDIPYNLRKDYKRHFENMDKIAVRELNAKEIVEKYSNKKAEVVLDPTLLIRKEEWRENAAHEIKKGDKYVLIYTLSGSKYIRDLAKKIALNIDADCKVINIKSDFRKEKDDGIEHLYDVGPEEWVGLIMNAAYMVTDSFHGTAFSINFNIPFTTLLNPSSNMNSRVLSILKIAGLEDRILYDDGKNKMPSSLTINFNRVNDEIELWRLKSIQYLIDSLG